MSLRLVLAGALGLLSLASVGCSSGFEVNKDPTTDPPPNTPPALPSGMANTGTLDLALSAEGDANDVVVSFGLPFPQGILKGERDVTLKNAAGAPVAITTSVLARWPGDGSIRSVLVAFRTTLANGAKETWKVDYGAPSTSPDA